MQQCKIEEYDFQLCFEPEWQLKNLNWADIHESLDIAATPRENQIFNEIEGFVCTCELFSQS